MEPPISRDPEPSEPVTRPHRGLVAATFGLILAAYLAGAFVFAKPRGIWSPDCGARLIQVQSVLQHPPEWWVSYPAADLDPDHQNSPLSFYEYNHKGRTYVFYSFLFALASAPLFQALGYFGLAVLPVLGGVLAAYATYLIALRLRLRFPLAPALIGAFLTPMALYSVVFWDHSILAGLATLAAYLALRGGETGRGRFWLFAGLTLGAALWLHEILLPYLPALILGGLWMRRGHHWGRSSLLLVAGFVALAIPLALINAKVYGSPAGPHLANNGLGSPKEVLAFMANPAEWGPGALYTLIGWGNANPAFTPQLKVWLANPAPSFQLEIRASLLMAIPLVVWLPLALSGWWRKLWPLTLLVIAGVVASGWWVLTHGEWAHSPFYACPLLMLAFAAPFRKPRPGSDGLMEDQPRLLLQTLAIITAAYTLMTLVKPTLGGTEWGSRHLLSTVPALVILSWAAIEALLPHPAHSAVPTWLPGAQPELAGVAVLIILSGLLLGHGTRIVYGMHWNNRRLTDVLAAAPEEVVVTTNWWPTLNAAPIYMQRKFLYVSYPDHPAPPLFERLRGKGVIGYTLLSGRPDDLAYFAQAAGYAPVAGEFRRTPFDLVTARYIRLDSLDKAFPPQ